METFDISSHNLSVLAEECERRFAGPKKLAGLCRAWNVAWRFQENMSLELIRILGYCAEPGINSVDSWRKKSISSYGLSIEPCEPEKINERMIFWWSLHPEMTSKEFYTEFQFIQPLSDGNRRVGLILYNWKKGQLKEMENPPHGFY